jgi:hypothetical protein
MHESHLKDMNLIKKKKNITTIVHPTFFTTVWKFNESNPADPIRSVLCPGLGTAVGFMPRDRCAYQV